MSNGGGESLIKLKREGPSGVREISTMGPEFEASRAEHAGRVQTLKAELGTMKKEHDTLQNEIRQLTKQAAKLEDQIESNLTQIYYYQTILIEKPPSINSYETAIKDAEDDIKLVRLGLSNLRGQKGKEEAIKKSEEGIQKRTKRIADLKTIIDGCRRDIREATAGKETLMNEVYDKSTKLSKTLVDIEDKKKKAYDLKASIHIKAQQVGEHVIEVAEINKELSWIYDREAAIKAKMEELSRV